MESTIIEIDGLLKDGLLLVNDTEFIPNALVDFKKDQIDTINGKMLLELAIEFRDKCEFITLFKQLIKTIICSKITEELLNIDTDKASSLILNTFNQQHKFFINLLWNIIYKTGSWPVIKFTLSIGLAIVLSRKS